MDINFFLSKTLSDFSLCYMQKLLSQCIQCTWSGFDNFPVAELDQNRKNQTQKHIIKVITRPLGVCKIRLTTDVKLEHSTQYISAYCDYVITF